jgi:hypothetical protein
MTCLIGIRLDQIHSREAVTLFGCVPLSQRGALRMQTLWRGHKGRQKVQRLRNAIALRNLEEAQVGSRRSRGFVWL